MYKTLHNAFVIESKIQEHLQIFKEFLKQCKGNSRTKVESSKLREFSRTVPLFEDFSRSVRTILELFLSKFNDFQEFSRTLGFWLTLLTKLEGKWELDRQNTAQKPRQALMVFFGCPYLNLFSKIVLLIVFFIIGSNKELLLFILLDCFCSFLILPFCFW